MCDSLECAHLFVFDIRNLNGIQPFPRPEFLPTE